jgi:HAD superfamily hydrolase (TIGR01490 family)
MNLILFDLDNTLLKGDSDYEWGNYLAEIGVVDKKTYTEKNAYFFSQYQEGTLDPNEYAKFSYEPLAKNKYQDLIAWRNNFIEKKIRPMILPKAIELLDRHRNHQDTLAIITSTNKFITEPIANELNVDHLIATELEMQNGEFTGKIIGHACFQENKINCLNSWLEKVDEKIESTWFYTDSYNDLPLLEHVTNPVVVDADQRLSEHANKKGWQKISLR